MSEARIYLRLFFAALSSGCLLLAVSQYDNDTKCTKYLAWAIYFGVMGDA